jgi:protein adenylyltransferase
METEAVEFCEFDNSYSRLPGRYFARLRPTPVAAPRLVRLNTKLALDLGLNPEELSTPDGVEMLAGNLVPRGGEPLAMAYAGRQFGTFVPQLGDGRAILLGEVIDRASRSGHRTHIEWAPIVPTECYRQPDRGVPQRSRPDALTKRRSRMMRNAAG